MEATASVLENLTLPDSEGKEVTLRDLWENHPVVFVWLRHYG